MAELAKTCRVTQQDIALRAGVHRSTVSLAFKNDPSIPVQTKKRIHRIASKMGYSPDPMLSALAAYRTRRRPATYHGTLAWIVNSAFDFHWQNSMHFSDYYRGAAARAPHHGYQVETFDLHAMGISTARLAGILRARNVDGLLLCPQPKAEMKMDFDWNRFSTVTFGYSLLAPRLHIVAAAHYRHMLQCLREVRRLGYKRIGFVTDLVHDDRINHNFLAAYLADQLLVSSDAIPPLRADYKRSPELLAKWLKTHEPDVIVTGNDDILNFLGKAGVQVPGDLGVACVGLSSLNTQLTGMIEDSEVIGQVATDFLVAMIQRGERGLPEHPQRVIIEGRWVSGQTLRKTMV
ncbi:MAG: LacI family DNA-binding transcriptional regulator [Terrimicrobiaceae bacterium]